MKKILLAVTLVMLLSGAGCDDDPEHNPCEREGARKYTSKYGNFTCERGRRGQLHWTEN